MTPCTDHRGAAARGLAALRGVAGDLVKELGPLNPADVEKAKARKVSTRNRDFKTDETNLSPFAKVALHAVEQHAQLGERPAAQPDEALNARASPRRLASTEIFIPCWVVEQRGCNALGHGHTKPPPRCSSRRSVRLVEEGGP